MSLLDKPEVQDICVSTFVSTLHCALENGVDIYVNERQKVRHYRARSTEEISRRKRMPNHIFFTSRGAYINCAIKTM